MVKRARRQPGPPLAAGPGSLGEWLAFLGAEPDDPSWVPYWPPDAFAMGAAILRRTGAYTGLVNGSYTRSRAVDPGGPAAAAVGREWRTMLARKLKSPQSEKARLRDACPSDVKRWWGHVRRTVDRPLASCTDDAALVAALANLCVAADEACENIGLGSDSDPFLVVAGAILVNNDRRSYCLRVPVEKLAVLGKQHTPQRGCSVRSLSHYLALYTPTEIRAYWEAPYTPATGDLDVFNLLLLPWPTVVGASDFESTMRRHTGSAGAVSGQPQHRYFDYSPAGVRPSATAARVRRALERATRDTDRIHAIVFPELALTPDQFTAVEKVAIQSGAILISGVRGAASSRTNHMPYNASVIQPLGLTAAAGEVHAGDRFWRLARKVQLKHHRWCLDRDQILQYGLGGRLPASRDCWERIFIGPREISFVTFSSWLTTCVLICEDLARQDPVTEVVRSVGPNLVFALLMDGPQLRNRWSSRYASVLAEDPGCSVLSLTSLGMARRSRPRTWAGDAVDKSSTIALWRDAIEGEREIAVADGHDACVLSLVSQTRPEYTIDGRLNGKPGQFPVFAGSFSFSSDEAPPAVRPVRYTRRRIR